ncbi:flavin-containing monooxygenase [Amycolatopsis thermoflava]|uniref:flavin-containing monooxygenase n=1 Tax=Amycolatopsis thermoflava TaxID=84480 RepID=UPI00056A8244|nr:NAD(P)/FAD-dependent oxidoreductase [Amycolatopsis thermoflava]
MRVAIVGAGISGLTTAKVLTQAGHDVVVFDRCPDVGGVWSRTRRYPGVTTQSPAAQYAFSDFPMPKDFPEWPTGRQVQEYLASYARNFGIDSLLRLETEVESVVPDAGGWLVTTKGDGVPETERFDRVVVANGVFCEPAVPKFPGVDEFRAAGGVLMAGTEFLDLDDARDRHAVVVGYGKSACDVTVAIASVAASTDIVARQLLWKIPRKVAGVLNFKVLLMTRLGEALFRYRTLRGFEKFLHGPGDKLRRSLINSIGSVSVKQFGLDKLDLIPRGTMEGIVRGAIGLATEGFFEGVEAGTIRVRRDRTIARLYVDGEQRYAELDDGTAIPADIIVCATGFQQSVPFLDANVQAKLHDDRGNFALYRQIQPLDVPGLYFNGYNSSFFSPLNAELAALWIAADVEGILELPSLDARREQVTGQLEFMDDALGSHHCRGTKIIPFSLHHADEVLTDLDLQIGVLTRAFQWLAPVDPATYRKVTPALLDRIAAARAAQPKAAPVLPETSANKS